MGLSQKWKLKGGDLWTTAERFPQNTWTEVYCPLCLLGTRTKTRYGHPKGTTCNLKQCGTWCPLFELYINDEGTIYAALHCAFDATYVIETVEKE